jgi:ABC-type polysaccharide/polyol phosphate transport system ATPase subunit
MAQRRAGSPEEQKPCLELSNVHVDFEVGAARLPRVQYALAGMFGAGRISSRRVHALQGVSLTLHEGDRLGIIGANGAGKTTLLKVMAGIYHPTAGVARVQGRVSPLFEMATGFEMESTGWDNIITRGLLLGMSMAEINRKMPEIAEFSELGEFLSLPVRCYSTGMFLRLAFSISTAVEPQILLLDEIIGAGDLSFYTKARARMMELVERSAILVLVTHALPIIVEMCNRAIWLGDGRILADGEPAKVVAAYGAGQPTAGQPIPA